MSLGWQVCGRENTENFDEHAAIAPELCLIFDRFPDCRPTADGIDAAEHDIARFLLWSIAIENGDNLDAGIDPLNTRP